MLRSLHASGARKWRRRPTNHCHGQRRPGVLITARTVGAAGENPGIADDYSIGEDEISAMHSKLCILQAAPLPYPRGPSRRSDEKSVNLTTMGVKAAAVCRGDDTNDRVVAASLADKGNNESYQIPPFKVPRPESCIPVNACTCSRHEQVYLMVTLVLIRPMSR